MVDSRTMEGVGGGGVGESIMVGGRTMEEGGRELGNGERCVVHCTCIPRRRRLRWKERRGPRCGLHGDEFVGQTTIHRFLVVVVVVCLLSCHGGFDASAGAGGLVEPESEGLEAA